MLVKPAADARSREGNEWVLRDSWSKRQANVNERHA